MTTLRAHFDGARIVLDEPMPAGVPAGTPVQILVQNGQNGHMAKGPAGSGLLGDVADLATPLDLPSDFAAQHEHYVKGKPKR